jgi:hypothetical protein
MPNIISHYVRVQSCPEYVAPEEKETNRNNADSLKCIAESVATSVRQVSKPMGIRVRASLKDYLLTPDKSDDKVSYRVCRKDDENESGGERACQTFSGHVRVTLKYNPKDKDRVLGFMAEFSKQVKWLSGIDLVVG